MSIHTPVLLNEVLEYLNISGTGAGKKIIDATLGDGGHSRAILEKFPEAKILGIELDPVFIKEIQTENLKGLIVINDCYTNLPEIVKKYNFKPDGIIFDLGLSSWHYEKSGRGFSFKKDELLDMRFNPEIQKLTAAEIINNYSESELEEILREYGEEKFSKEIARSVAESRKEKAIADTKKLVTVIEKAVPGWYKHRKIHFATKTFQALRVAVNNELGNVKQGVQAAISVLKPGGRLIAISFQGLEDKIVKNIFKEKAKEGIIKWVTKDTIKPKWEEIKNNPRARSAKMKIIEKI